jgi:hypothetical protein
MEEGSGEETRKKDVGTKDYIHKQMETCFHSHGCHKGGTHTHTAQPPPPPNHDTGIQGDKGQKVRPRDTNLCAQ